MVRDSHKALTLMLALALVLQVIADSANQLSNGLPMTGIEFVN